MKQKLLLSLSLLSSFLIFYEPDFIKIMLCILFDILVYLFLNKFDFKFKDLNKYDFINIILISIILISKGIHTYGSLTRFFPKSYRFIASIIFCIPNLYWICWLSHKINGVICEILENKFSKKLLNVVYIYLIYRLGCLFIEELFPDFNALSDFNYALFYYISIILYAYAIQRFIRVKKDYAFKSLAIFLAIIFITSHINAMIQGSYIIIYQLYYTLNTSINFLLIYPIGEYIVKNKIYIKLYNFFEHFLYIWTVFIAFVIVVLLLNIKLKYFPYIIMDNGNRLSFDGSPISAGNLESVITLFSLITLYNQKNKHLKILDLICCLINCCALSLANSRMSFYAFILCFVMMVSTVFIKKVNLIKTVSIALFSLTVVYFGRVLLFKVIMTTNGIGHAREIVDGTVFLSGRDKIWLTGLRYLINNPLNILIGVSQVSVGEILNLSYAKAMHNEYLQILMAYGIFGLASYAIFSVLTISNSIKLFFNKSESIEIKLFIPVIVVVMLNYLTVNGVTSNFTYDTILFFMSCGIINSYCAYNK